ncbi:MAG: right-handed parallel beta-helix repeat-containing protein, partial [Chloroflexi bacterium]|nr:right-handed parallel beta-helix repeat-containing protein [Chloroflexota bacterium]
MLASTNRIGKRLVLTGLATTIATLAVVAVCAFFARAARAGGPIYVDADYTGVEMGSDSQPFNTIQEVHDASSNGVADVIYIKAATANPYASFSVSRGGYSPDAPDVYTVWPGTGSYPRISENVARLVYINASYVTIDGLDIDGSAGGSTGDLVRADSGSYITIRNCKVHDSALDEGIQLTHAPHAWVENVESYNNAGDGINLCCGSYSSTVRFNYTHDNAGASAHGGFYFYEDGQSMDGLLVEHNVSVGNREAGINLRDVDGALIRNNLISGTLSNGARGVGILLNDSTTSNTVFNNTIFGSASDGVLVCDAEGLNNVILDNIIVSSTDYAIYATSPTQTVDYNLYWNSGVSETFNVATGAHSLVDDPLFATGPDGPEPDFYLDPSSPAVDAGSQTAASARLALCATRADRQSDQGIVDLGYHYPAMPYTLTLEADPSAITADGLATTIVTATLRTATSGAVGDGSAVVFRTTAGYFGNWMEIYAVQTTNGVAVAVLNSVPSGASVTATVGADAYGTSDETQVTFAAPACGADMTDWAESTANPIFGQGVDGGPKAYYPSVLYSPTAFDGH